MKYLAITLIYFLAAGSCERNAYWDKVKNIEDFTFKTAISKTLNETSGLVEMNDKMWSFNDSGGEPTLYRFSKKDGKIKQSVKIKGAKNKDWEAICKNDKDIFICDFGNNSENRNDLSIYQISQSKFTKNVKQVTFDKKIDFNYPDDHVNHNCEAIAYKAGYLYIFTKNGADGKTNVFRLIIQEEPQVAEFIDQYDVQGLVTAADWTDDQLVLLGYQGGHGNFFPFLWHFDGSTATNIFPKKPKSYRIAQDLQFEAITKVKDKYYVSNEKSNGVSQSLWTFPLNQE